MLLEKGICFLLLLDICGAGAESVAVSRVTAPPEDILHCGLSMLVIVVPQK